MPNALIRIFLYLLIAILPLMLAALSAVEAHNLLQETGKSFALLGIMILSLQIPLAARIKGVERAFGLDILIRFHKHMGVFAVVLLLFHPLLLAAGRKDWNLLLGLDLPWYILLGKATLLLLIVNVSASTYQRSIRLKFENWRFIHDLLGPAIILLAFIHSWFAGHHLQLPFMKALWLVVLALSLSLYIYHRMIRPRRLKSRPYRVSEVVPETENVWTVKMVPPEGQTIEDYAPGQFHFLTFYRKRTLPVEEHHWTISSSPSQKGYVSSTIKALGDFTSTMGRTEKGDRVAVHGTFGRFSYVFHPEEKDLVFIAGGIGITPLMAMLRHMRDTRDRRSVTLLYANQKESDIVFLQELSKIQAGEFPALRAAHVLSRAGKGWHGERGHVNREKIEKYCGVDIANKTFYVCCPPGMLKAVLASLKDLGVLERRIRIEIFSFLD
jgi:predicted ferric reductase